MSSKYKGTNDGRRVAQLEELSRLIARYEFLLDQRDAQEWRKLFDRDFRQLVLKEIRIPQYWLPARQEVVSALDRFIDEIGDPTGSALALRDRLSKVGHDVDKATRDVDLLWLEILAGLPRDQDTHKLLREPVDEFLESELARERGKYSGKARRQKQDDVMNRAAMALNSLLDEDPMNEPEDYSLKEIATKSDIPIRRLKELRLHNILARASELRKSTS